MATQIINVPDIGGAENVDVIEVCVSEGDTIAIDDALVVLESDKASMDVPSPAAGKIVSLKIKEGDKVSEGDALLELEVEGGGAQESAEPESASADSSASAPASAGGAERPVAVPDIGGAEGVDVIELCVAVGDEVAEGDSLIVLESDKASMDIPSPAAGKVVSIAVAEGDKLSEGDAILVLASDAPAEVSPSPAPAASPAPAPAAVASSEMDVAVPDIGGAEGVDVIEVCVAEGDEISEGESLIVLESDKASMEVPAPKSGKVVSLKIKEGDKVSQGDAILSLAVEGASSAATPSPAPASAAEKAAAPAPAVNTRQRTSEQFHDDIRSAGSEVYAGPAARKLAREMAVDLANVQGTGPRSRVSKDDIKAYVKSVMQGKAAKPAAAMGGSGIPTPPEVDYAQFGEVELVKMSKIKQLTAEAMTRNWLNIPRVTQFDDADITEVEAFRKGMKAEAEKAGVKLTPLPFIIKAAAAALKAEPSFNVAMHNDGEHIIQKKFIHIAIAVDTPRGLMVPVLKNADQKGIYEIAREVIELAGKARDGKLKPNEMQGGCFTISSLGPIGGTGFTPMVSTTEAGILGVSKAAMKPVWNGKEFEPRLMLPLSLSYDHRAVNGGDAGRFITFLSTVLGDVRRLLL